MEGSLSSEFREIQEKVFCIRNDTEFRDAALMAFDLQYRGNPIYRAFADNLGTRPGIVGELSEIPFLPIEFFRDHRVITGDPGQVEEIFISSGTTASIQSRHFVADIGLYRKSLKDGFRYFYGDPADYLFLVLLPGYAERKGSSLVYMMEYLAGMGKAGSGFFLVDQGGLRASLDMLQSGLQKVIVFGASYALLDFVEAFPVHVPGAIIMETGGMKGRRDEMVREELHRQLCSGFGVDRIHSEYGMTELLSQAYSKGYGRFTTPPWMKVLVRDINDPFSFMAPGRTGGISIIDLANLHSCAFIATQDLGRMDDDGSFEVLGRFDNSEVRGCNLLVS